MARKPRTRTKSASTSKKATVKRTSSKAKTAQAVCCETAKPQEKRQVRLSPEHYNRLVREQAYYLWERRGRKHGCNVGNWHEAERIVQSRLSGK